MQFKLTDFLKETNSINFHEGVTIEADEVSKEY